MRGVGYVAGGSLDEIQSQWAEFIEADVDVILFDREILSPEFNLSSPEQSNPEKESIWKYMETMEAAQTMSGNYARYETLDDLVPGDTIVLSSIKNLSFATKGIWEKIAELNAKGVHLAILSYGFHSNGEYGDKIFQMLDDTYRLGKENNNK